MSIFFKRAMGLSFSFFSIIYVFMLFHYALTMWETGRRYGIIFLGMSFLLISINLLQKNDFEKLAGKIKGILIFLGLLASVGGCLYFWREYMALQLQRSGDLNNYDVWISLVLVFISVVYCWLTSGATIPVVAMIFISYAFWGNQLPGFLRHMGVSMYRFAEFSAGEISGIFGSLTVLGATYIAMFVFFAGFVQGFGGLDYIMRLSYKIVGKSPTGLPQIAVISSMAFGCMSGSPAANAAGTGALTIPTMKRFGIPGAVAAAVETVASSGGQIMPPILGAVAFVMCEYLGLFYYEVLMASFFPALIYFIVLMLSVYFIGARYAKQGKEEDIPDDIKRPMTKRELLLGLPLLFGLMSMVLLFIIFRLNIMFGGLIGTIVFLVVQFIYDLTGSKQFLETMKGYVLCFYNGILTGTKMMLQIVPMLAVLGVVVRILAVTGLADKITFALIEIGTHNVWAFLFLTMCVCIMFGMAVTTVGAYILVVTLVAPAMIRLGTPALITHFAVFYWALLSGFTPPVAGVCIITSQIAKSNFWSTCWESMKLGLPIFILPYFFVSYPELLTFSGAGLKSFVMALAGLLALASSLQALWSFKLRIILALLGLIILFVELYWLDLALSFLVLLMISLLLFRSPKREAI